MVLFYLIVLEKVVEPSEEMKLRLVSFVNRLLRRAIQNVNVNVLIPIIEPLCNTLVKTVVDPYPDLKQESCVCIDLICNLAEIQNEGILFLNHCVN